MSEKKSLLNTLFGGKPSGCCNMQITEAPKEIPKKTGKFEKTDKVNGAAYGKQSPQSHRRHGLPSTQAGYSALYGEENRQNYLPGLGVFQRNQQRNDGG